MKTFRALTLSLILPMLFTACNLSESGVEVLPIPLEVSETAPTTIPTSSPTATSAVIEDEQVVSGDKEVQIEAAPTTVFDPEGLSAGAGRGFIVLDDPVLITAAEATWLEVDDIVLGVVQNGEAHAYPISQMAYHHIANTKIGGEPYLVTY